MWAVALVALLFLTACDIPGPEARRQALHLPPLGFKGVVAKGVEPFEKYCMACHGPKGQGTEQGPRLLIRSIVRIIMPISASILRFGME